MSLVFHRILDLKTGVYIYTAPFFFAPTYHPPPNLHSTSFQNYRKRTSDVSIMDSPQRFSCCRIVEKQLLAFLALQWFPWHPEQLLISYQRFIKERLSRLFNFGKKTTGKVSTFPIFFYPRFLALKLFKELYPSRSIRRC